MKFNPNFFLVAVGLSLLAGILQNLSSWLLVLYTQSKLSIDIYSQIAIGLPPVQLALGVILPFAVMYILSTRIGSEVVQSVIVSTFVGCWIGGVINFAVRFYLLYLRRSSLSVDSVLQLSPWVVWAIFETAFSTVFFVSLAAILFAYYRKTVSRQTIPT